MHVYGKINSIYVELKVLVRILEADLGEHIECVNFINCYRFVKNFN